MQMEEFSLAHQTILQFFGLCSKFIINNALIYMTTGLDTMVRLELEKRLQVPLRILGRCMYPMACIFTVYMYACLG